MCDVAGMLLLLIMHAYYIVLIPEHGPHRELPLRYVILMNTVIDICDDPAMLYIAHNHVE